MASIENPSNPRPGSTVPGFRAEHKRERHFRGTAARMAGKVGQLDSREIHSPSPAGRKATDEHGSGLVGLLHIPVYLGCTRDLPLYRW